MWPQAGSTPGAAAAHVGPQRSDPVTGALSASVVGKATSSVRGAARAAAVVLPPAERGSTDPPSTSTGTGSVRPACRMCAMCQCATCSLLDKKSEPQHASDVHSAAAVMFPRLSAGAPVPAHGHRVHQARLKSAFLSSSTACTARKAYSWQLCTIAIQEICTPYTQPQYCVGKAGE